MRSENGAKSRGPVTSGGKSISSRNATRHALLANTLTLNIELKDSFLDLVAELFDEFQPQTPFEESLVESMAAARWRLWRTWSIESAALNHEVGRQTSTEHCATRVALALRELSDHSRSLDLMSRYEVRYERQYLRFHRRLMEVRGTRTPPPASPFLVPKPQPVPDADPAPGTQTESICGAGNRARRVGNRADACSSNPTRMHNRNKNLNSLFFMSLIR
jgi:hypothetical protein